MPIEHMNCTCCANSGSCADYDPDHPHRCQSISCDECSETDDDAQTMYEVAGGTVLCNKCLMRYLVEQGIIKPTVDACSHPDECLDCPNDGSDLSIPVRSWYVKKTRERVCDEFLWDYLEENDIIDRIS